MEIMKQEYIIIFKDFAKKIISENIYKALIQSWGTKEGIMVGENYYDYKSISKILTMNEYYSLYPDAKPPTYNQQENFKDDRPESLEDIIACSKKRRDLVLKGLKNYREKYALNPEKIDIMIENMEKRGKINTLQTINN
jgi:hypothetical protein